MITKEVFDTIINDIRSNDRFIDVEKSDFMNFMCNLYSEYATDELIREIESLD